MAIWSVRFCVHPYNSVSYTHLDVYKRQIYMLLITINKRKDDYSYYLSVVHWTTDVAHSVLSLLWYYTCVRYMQFTCIIKCEIWRLWIRAAKSLVTWCNIGCLFRAKFSTDAVFKLGAVRFTISTVLNNVQVQKEVQKYENGQQEVVGYR